MCSHAGDHVRRLRPLVRVTPDGRVTCQQVMRLRERRCEEEEEEGEGDLGRKTVCGQRSAGNVKFGDTSICVFDFDTRGLEGARWLGWGMLIR
ncbi:hypothetical protein E2C01_018638 [Portunus trituberculatus]|uniref:Uncharacterized protein n=1 Tax=Portunus trituberculatus TaxID=210409 RepID=A0A5B7DVI5_PORTR|nr:hypothetical protein [Portunus trituberculatus]